MNTQLLKQLADTVFALQAMKDSMEAGTFEQDYGTHGGPLVLQVTQNRIELAIAALQA
jgi:hypothetical protein